MVFGAQTNLKPMIQTESCCCPLNKVGLSLRPYRNHRSPDFSRRPFAGQTWELLVKAGFSLKRRWWFHSRGSRVPASSESRVVGRSFETSFTLLRFDVHLHPASVAVEQNWENLPYQLFTCTTTAGLKLQAPVCFLDQGMFPLCTFKKQVYLNINGWRPRSTKVT